MELVKVNEITYEMGQNMTEKDCLHKRRRIRYFSTRGSNIPGFRHHLSTQSKRKL